MDAMDQGTLPPTRRRPLNPMARLGAAVLLAMFVLCVVTLPWTIPAHDNQALEMHHTPPGAAIPQWLGADALGRSLLARCLLGGAISLGIGLAAAAIAVIIGTAWGLVSGYAGGRTDAFMMRIVDVLYGLPYILLVLLLVVAVQGIMDRLAAMENPPSGVGVLQRNAWLINIGSLLLAIGAVSWLTLARVVRGQVLSLKTQPFIEAARAAGCGNRRILIVHLLPNLLGPVIVYTTLTVPQAILQESFLSFLGIGVQPPLPSWGNLAAEGLKELNPVRSYWWLLAAPCVLLGVTLLSLNFLGDGLRDKYDPRASRN
jgi:oligopeptide transport system permease protein